MSIISFKNTVIGTEEVNSVNARELHKAIQAKQHFADWIRNRIKKYGFEENQDYIVVTEHTQGRPLKEYYITLDMAKELAMVENNEQGRKIRRYFIEVEKEFRAKATEPQIKELEHKIKELETERDEYKKYTTFEKAYDQAIALADRYKQEADTYRHKLEQIIKVIQPQVSLI